MTRLQFTALPTPEVRALQSGGLDANGQKPERSVSDGGGNPCRHCLRDIHEGADMLILGYRPFPDPQPYAETGPIFLCADACERWAKEEAIPPVLQRAGEARLLKGYSPDDRIVYGLGRVAATPDISAEAEKMLEDPRVAYVHVRSSTNNCFTCRVDPA